MAIDGNEIFKSIQENCGAHYDRDDWIIVDWLPTEEMCAEVFVWLKENKICYILTTKIYGQIEAGFGFWSAEDAIAFKLRWL